MTDVGTVANAPDEVELKAVVDDPAVARRRVEAAGGRLVFEGRLEDRRYDTAARSLAAVDYVLRLRVYHDASGARAALDWKGPTRYEAGYKVREELTTRADSPDALALILARLGYVVTREIDREIAQYDLHGAIVRFEHYPRMDTLVEVEGPPATIEGAIGVLGIERRHFTTERLPDFIARFQSRTGERAAVSKAELAGDYRFALEDA